MPKLKIDNLNAKQHAISLENNKKNKHYAVDGAYYKQISPTNKKDQDAAQLNYDLSKELRRNNIWDPDDINYHQFRYRFGIPDPKGQIGSAREYLFFTKPDIPIFEQDDWTLNIKSTKMQPVLERSTYWRELRYNNFPVLYELQASIDKKNPFNNLLGNTVSNNLDIPSLSGEVIDTPNNQYGTNIQYRGSSEASNDSFDFSLEFKDTKELSVYHYFKAYEDFQTLRHNGGGFNKNDKKSLRIPYYYIINKILYDQFSIYKFMVDEDGETIIYYAKLYGVFTKNLPRDAFSNTQFDGGITFNIDFHAAFYDDMNPRIIEEFNRVSSADNRNIRIVNALNTDKPETLPYVLNPVNIYTGRMDYRRATGAFVQTLNDIDHPLHRSYYGGGKGNIYKLKWVTIDSLT